MVTKNLTIRFDPEMREKLSLIAEREVRPMASQVVVFVRQGIEKYIQDNDLEFLPTEGDPEGFTEGGLILRNRYHGF